MKKVLGLRISALFEMLAIIAAILSLDLFFGQGNRFLGSELHPFWVVIVLISMQYGLKEGLVSWLLCSIALLAGNLPLHEFTQSYYGYWLSATYIVWMWLLAAAVLGMLSDKHKSQKLALISERDSLQAREQTISDAYLQLRETKEAYEVQLASQQKNVAGAYKIIADIEAMEKDVFLDKINGAVRLAMSPMTCSFYIRSEVGFKLYEHYGWKTDDAYLREFDFDSVISRAILDQNKSFFCVLKAEDAEILAEDAVMLAVIKDKSNEEVVGFIKIETYDFAQLTMSSMLMFQELSCWLSFLYTRELRYQQEASTARVLRKYSEGDEQATTVS